MLWACPPVGYRIPGGTREPARAPLVRLHSGLAALRLARGWPRPMLRVAPVGALADRRVRATVVSNAPSAPSTSWRLALALLGGLHVSVFYTPPGATAIPVVPGQAVEVRYIPPDPNATPRGPALIVRDPAGGLIAAIAAGGGLPAGSLGENLQILPSERLVYSEIRRLPSLCVVALEHRALRLRLGDRFIYMPPGTFTEINLGGVHYRVIALDLAQPGETSCPDPRIGQISFAIMRAPLADVGPAAAP